MEWNKLTIRQFTEIAAIIKDQNGEELDTQIEILSVCTGKTPEQYRDMPLPELKKELAGLDGLNKREPVDVKGKYTINGRQYKLTVDFENMPAGQYIDYVNTLNSDPGNRAMIMAVLLVPRGCKYGEGYKISEVADELYQHMRWCDVEAICFFFRVYLAAFTKARLKYLNKKLRKEMKKETDPKKARVLKESIEKIRDLIAGIK